MKKLLIYGACLLLSMGAVSCHGDDPLANNVVVPSVPATPTKVSGYVTDSQGNPVAGATVTLGDKTVVTDENGYYEFTDVPAGNHTITIKKDGMFDATREVTVTSSQDTQNYQESFLMTEKKTQIIHITNGVVTSGNESVESSAIKGNDEGKVDISVEIPEDAIEETGDLEIWITPIYTSESAEVMDDNGKKIRGTRASSDENDMLIGATLQSSKPITLKKPIDIKFDLDESVNDEVVPMKINSDGTTTRTTHRIEKGNVIISASEFGSYGLFVSMTLTQTNGRENLKFDPSEWNNLNGSANMWAESSAYSYKNGSDITSKATTKLEGLLIEHLARKIGFVVKTVNATFPIRQSISVGAALRIWGWQERIEYTLTSKITRKSVKATCFGDLTIDTEGWLRDHNGGSSVIG